MEEEEEAAAEVDLLLIFKQPFMNTSHSGLLLSFMLLIVTVCGFCVDAIGSAKFLPLLINFIQTAVYHPVPDL